MTYYINPKTGRTIKQSGKTFKKLKSGHFKLDKDPCLYNESSAKRCLKKMMHYYPDLSLPSNTIPNNVTVIRNKRGKVRAVVSDKGDIYKLSEPLHINENVPELKTISHKHTELLNERIDKSKIIDSNKIKDKLHNKQGEDVVYNPLYNNYVVIGEQKLGQNSSILNKINKTLIPNTLPVVVPGTNISGFIENEQNQIAGYITEANEAKKFNKVLQLKVNDLQDLIKSKEIEIQELRNNIKDKTDNVEIIELNKQLIKLENEKKELRENANKRINELQNELVRLNNIKFEIKIQKESAEYYYSLIKQTLESWNPVEDDAEKYKSYGKWIKDIFTLSKPLKKTDNIESNLNDLVSRANQYANSRRSNKEHLKYIDALHLEFDKLTSINNDLKNKLIEYPLLEYKIDRLTKELNIANKRYNNSKITRDTLILSYENTIKGYIDAIESLKDNNVNIGVELGLLKERYNNLHELQNQIKVQLSDNSSEKNDSEYEFINKYFTVTQDYNILSDIVKNHEQNFEKLQNKNTELQNELKRLQQELLECGNAPSQLRTFKISLNEFRNKYNDIKNENDKNIDIIKQLTEENKSNQNENQNKLKNTIKQLTKELEICNQTTNKIKSDLQKQLNIKPNISLPNETINELPSEDTNVEQIIKNYAKKNCTGILKTNGLQYKLKWNDIENKCYIEEVVCQPGEMYSNDTKKCHPCKDYGLIFDKDQKKCIQQTIDILEDTEDNIIGYNNDNNWKTSINGRHN